MTYASTIADARYSAGDVFLTTTDCLLDVAGFTFLYFTLDTESII